MSAGNKQSDRKTFSFDCGKSESKYAAAMAVLSETFRNFYYKLGQLVSCL